MAVGLTTCAICRFWHGNDPRTGRCRRHAPSAGDHAYQAARWPETRSGDGCGEGELIVAGASPNQQVCGTCLFWDRPGVGIDPAQRGDHLHVWWQQAGWCRRYAPRPGVDIGEHAFWRATHSTDHCYDGRPVSLAPAPGRSE